MPAYKMTFLISDTRYGHSSTFILKASSQLTTQGLVAAANEMIGRLCPLFGNSHAALNHTPELGNPMVMAVRASLVGSRNQSQLLVQNGLTPAESITQDGTPTWTPNSGSQQLNSGLSLRIKTRYVPPVVVPALPTVFSNVTVWIPGVPDEVIKNDDFDTTGVSNAQFPNYSACVNRFVSYLGGTNAGQQWQWGHMGKDPATPIFQVSPASTAQTTLTWNVPVGHLINQGDLVQIMHANARGFNGTLRVSAVTATTVTTSYRDFPPEPLPTQARMRQYYNAVTGLYTQVVYDYIPGQPIGNPISITPAVRRPARPFNPVSFRHGSRLARSAR